MARLTPYVFQQFLDDNGNPLSGGKVYTYEAGTSTPKATYTTSIGDVAQSWPIVLDAAGRPDTAPIWLGQGAYKFILKTSSDVPVGDTYDDIAGEAQNAFGSSVVSISGNLSVTSAYKNNVIIATAVATLSLLPVESATDGFYFLIKNDSVSANVTIDPNLSELIDGAATAIVRPKQAAICICDGAEWKTLFLDNESIYANTITTTGASGVVIKNSAGATVATFGASAGTTSALTGALTLSGSVDISGTSSASAFITLAEDTDNGTNKVTITPPQSIASDYTLTLPSSTGTLINDVTFLTSLATALGVYKYVQLADQTITAAGALTVAHSLGKLPVRVDCFLVCQTGELGFTAGDVVPINTNIQGATSTGQTLTWDTTNVYIRFGGSAGAYELLHKTTGIRTATTAANWKLRLMVMA